MNAFTALPAYCIYPVAGTPKAGSGNVYQWHLTALSLNAVWVNEASWSTKNIRTYNCAEIHGINTGKQSGPTTFRGAYYDS